MSRIIRPATRQVVPTVGRLFRIRGDNEGWLSFPCDERGEVDREALDGAQRRQWDDCVSGALAALDFGRCTYARESVTPALLRCDCGRNLELADDTNVCEGCRREFASDGSLIARRAA